MSKKETLFRKYSTTLGKFPLMILPVLLVGGYTYVISNNFIVPITVLILLCATIGVSYILGSVVKLLYYKPRPEPQHYTNRLQKIDASSFPSIHTANSMILAFWGILSAIQIAPQTMTTYSAICFWLFFFMTISTSRVVLKKHFPIDIIAGVVFGAICILIVMVNTDTILGIADMIIQYIMSYL